MTGSLTLARAWLANAAGAAVGGRPPVALCYHGVGSPPKGDDPHGLYVSEVVFAGQLDRLLERGYRLVAATELWQQLRVSGPRGADRLAAITFDDGLAESMHTAARLLAARGGRGTAFVLPALSGGPHPHAPDDRLLDDVELRILADDGVLEIASHSLLHADLRLLDDAAVAADLRESKRRLEAVLERPVDGLAYPYGRYTDRTVAAADAAGYAYACACWGSAPWDRFALPREPVFPSTSPLRFRLKLAGLYGPVTRVSGLRGARRDAAGHDRASERAGCGAARPGSP